MWSCVCDKAMVRIPIWLRGNRLREKSPNHSFEDTGPLQNSWSTSFSKRHLITYQVNGIKIIGPSIFLPILGLILSFWKLTVWPKKLTHSRWWNIIFSNQTMLFLTLIFFYMMGFITFSQFCTQHILVDQLNLMVLF